MAVPSLNIVGLQDFLPDQPEFTNPASPSVKNAVPTPGGYTEWRAIAEATNSLTATVVGMFAARSRLDVPYNFAATAEKIFELSRTSWNDVSSSLSSYALGDDDYRDFCQFGELVVTTAFVEPTQYYEMGSSSAFASLGTGAPMARHCAVVRDFVVLANVNDVSLGASPSRVVWGPRGDPQGDWTPADETQAGLQDIRGDGGHVQQIVGGEFGLVFQEKAVTRMTFEGPPLKFSFDEIEAEQGTPAPGSVIKVGSVVYYVGQNGFYATDGASPAVPIGSARVDEWFFDKVDDVRLFRIRGAYDPFRNVIVWACPSSQGGGQLDFLVFYHIGERRFSWAEVSLDYLALMRGEQGLTLEEIGAIYGSLENVPFSLDSREWKDNTVALQAFSTVHRMGPFAGSPLTAVIDSKLFQPIGSRKSQISLYRPVVEGSSLTSLTVEAGMRNILTDNTAYRAPVGANNQGNHWMRISGRYHQARVNIAGGFSKAIGVEYEWVDDGER